MEVEYTWRSRFGRLSVARRVFFLLWDLLVLGLLVLLLFFLLLFILLSIVAVKDSNATGPRATDFNALILS